MALFWPIHVVVLLIFLAATVDYARTSGSKATPKKTTQQPVVTTTKTEACGRWTKSGTSFFSFCKCTQWCSFNSARKKCRQKQAELAKCTSRKLEKFFVLSLKTKNIFLGGNDRVDEGTWRWPDRSLLNKGYTNWGLGQPFEGPEWDCLLLYAPYPFWYDVPCHAPYSANDTGFVCEKKKL